jgi:hypothetical protein
VAWPRLDGAGMTSNNGDLEKVVRENLKLRRQVVAEFAKASEPVSFGQKVRQWSSAHFGRSEDQPLILALLIVLIAITLYVFL